MEDAVLKQRKLRMDCEALSLRKYFHKQTVFDVIIVFHIYNIALLN